MAVIVQARMGSTRLPGKVLLPLSGKPVIAHVLERCGEIPGIDRVACAIPDTTDNRPLAAAVKGLGVDLHSGSERDVLARYYHAAVALRADIILRVTADCPLIAPEVCGQVLGLLRDSGLDYASNVNPRGYPKGLDCEAFTFETLHRAHLDATAPYDREHVCPWMQRHTRTANLPGPGSDERWVLDTPEDYARLKTLMEDQ